MLEQAFGLSETGHWGDMIMGLYQGGLLMTLLYFTVIGFFIISGVAAERAPGAIQSIQCLPNTGSINQYAGLDANSTGSSNCFNDTNSTGLNFNTQQDSLSTALNAAFGLVPGANVLLQVATIVRFMILGWILILQIIIGTSSPLSILIFAIGVPLQLLQLYFLAQIIIQILAAIRGGAQPQ